MNLVFLFLVRFREFCKNMLFEQNLDLYIGKEPWVYNRKTFYRSFISNMIFDNTNPISNIAYMDVKNSPNPIYVVAECLFNELQKVRSEIKTKSNNSTNLIKEFEYIEQISQVLIVLKIHFCKYASKRTFEKESTFFDNIKDMYIASPREWEFLSNEIIWSKLINPDKYAMTLTYTYSHTLNSDFIALFKHELSKGSFSRKLLFTEKAFNRLFEFVANNGYKIEVSDEEVAYVISRFFSKEEVSNDSLTRTYFKFFFIKELGTYYTLAGFSFREYSFDSTEYHDETSGDSCDVCFDSRVVGLFDEGINNVPVSMCSYIDIFE